LLPDYCFNCVIDTGNVDPDTTCLVDRTRLLIAQLLVAVFSSGSCAAYGDLFQRTPVELRQLLHSSSWLL